MLLRQEFQKMYEIPRNLIYPGMLSLAIIIIEMLYVTGIIKFLYELHYDGLSIDL